MARIVVWLMVVGAIGGATGCSCDEVTETMVVTRRGSAFFDCSTAIGDSDPPVCAAKPGDDGNERLEGPGVGDLAGFVEDGRTAVLRVRVRCGDVLGVVGRGY